MFKVPQQTYIFLKKFGSKCMAFGMQDMKAPLDKSQNRTT